MSTLAIVAEGRTDQVILERIIEEFFVDEVDVTYAQPLRDQTDLASHNFGGWELVFEYCRFKIEDVVSANDFVVVHLDTDQAEHPNFGVCLTSGGVDRSAEDIVRDVRLRLISVIGYELFEKIKSQVIFAISVHSIESWLLLYLFDRDEPKQSFRRLDVNLRRCNEKPLDKTVARYRELARAIRLKKLKKMKVVDESFRTFLNDLQAAASSV